MANKNLFYTFNSEAVLTGTQPTRVVGTDKRVFIDKATGNMFRFTDLGELEKYDIATKSFISVSNSFGGKNNTQWGFSSVLSGKLTAFSKANDAFLINDNTASGWSGKTWGLKDKSIVGVDDLARIYNVKSGNFGNIIYSPALNVSSISNITLAINNDETKAYVLYKDATSGNINLVEVLLSTMALGSSVDLAIEAKPLKIIVDSSNTYLCYLADTGSIRRILLDGSNQTSYTPNISAYERSTFAYSNGYIWMWGSTSAGSKTIRLEVATWTAEVASSSIRPFYHATDSIIAGDYFIYVIQSDTSGFCFLRITKISGWDGSDPDYNEIRMWERFGIYKDTITQLFTDNNFGYFYDTVANRMYQFSLHISGFSTQEIIAGRIDSGLLKFDGIGAPTAITMSGFNDNCRPFGDGDINLSLALNDNKAYVLYGCNPIRLSVIQQADLSHIDYVLSTINSSNTSKAKITDSKLIFTTKNNKINSCNLDGSGYIVDDFDGLFDEYNNNILGIKKGFENTTGIALYNLEDNEANTNVVDFNGNYNAVASVNTNTLSTTDRDGNPNSAFNFVNDTQCIDLPSLPNASEMSIFFRLKRTLIETQRPVFYVNNTGSFFFVLELQTSTTARFIFGNGATWIDIAIPESLDNYIDFGFSIKEIGSVKSYVDGAKVSEGVSSGFYTGTAELRNIGGTCGSATSFTGVLDLVMFADRQLTSQEFENLSNTSTKTLIKTYNVSLTEQSSLETNLANESIVLESHTIGTNNYSIIDNGSESILVKYNGIVYEDYNLSILSITAYQVAKFMTHRTVTNDIEKCWLIIVDTSDNVWRTDIDNWNITASWKQLRKDSIVNNSGVITVENSFNDTGTIQALNTEGFGDNPGGGE